MSEPLKCGFASGEDRNAEDEDEACGYVTSDTFDWLNHIEVEHRGADTVDCPRCGEQTKWAADTMPVVEFFNGGETVGVCLPCQQELLDELTGECSKETVAATDGGESDGYRLEG